MTTTARLALNNLAEPQSAPGKSTGSVDVLLPSRGPSVLRPICVDLDGTLLSTDSLFEGVLAILSSPTKWRSLPRLLTTSRATLKKRVADYAELDPTDLPYNDEVIAYLRSARAAGRRIVLATAANEGVAEAISRHLQLFDEVISSDDSRNLKGKHKAAALVERFGMQGFDYIGNDRSDLAVWRSAATIITVNASRRVIDLAASINPVEVSIHTKPSFLRSALRAVRPHQWSKNALVFVPMFTAHAVADPTSWAAALLVFVSFCATASAIYLINDLLDLASDRQHPRKRTRPLARGDISIPMASLLTLLLLSIGLGLGHAAGALPIILIYATVSILYSLALKRFPLVDVFVLAGLYTVRVIGGAMATGHPASLWLLAFSGFVFLSLALMKRTEELIAIEGKLVRTVNARRGYQPEDRLTLQIFGCASAFAAAVVLALFIGSTSAFEQYRSPDVLWLIVPLILFWLCRLWLATNRGSMHEDPIVFAFRDWVSWVTFGSVAVVMAAAASGVISLA